MGVKNHIRLALLFVCLMVVGIALYPYVPRLVKIAQAVQGELKFGAAMDQEMRIINKTFYSADVYFGNASGGTIGVMQGNGNLGIGMGTTTANMRTPNQRLSVADTMAITAPSGVQYLLMGNQDSGGAGNPAIIRAANGNLEIGKGTAWIGPGGTFTSNVFFGNNGNVGLGSTAPTKKLDVVGDINFSGTLYQAGVAYQGSQWTTSGSNIYYNTGNVGIGSTTPAAKLDVGETTGNGALKTVVARLGEGNTTGDGTYLGVKGWATQQSQYGGLGFSLEHHFYGVANSSVNFFRGGSTSGGFLTFGTNDNSEKVRIDASGNVGIGTTNPQKKLDIAAANSTINNTSGNLSIVPNANLLITQGSVGIGTTGPGHKLDVYRGNARIGVPYGDSNTSNWTSYVDTMTPGIPAIALQQGGSFGVKILADGQYLRFRNFDGGADGTDHMVIKTTGTGAGNIGIGSTTPGAKLDVGGTTSTIANVSGNLSIVPASNLVVTQGNVGIGTSNPGTANLAVMGGNVGIGTTGPLGKLHVVGGINNSLVVDRTGAPTGKRIQLFVGDGTVQGGMTFITDEPYFWGNNVDFHLGGWNPTAGVDKEYFTVIRTGATAGNVGIGNTGPTAKLDVTGGIIERASPGAAAITWLGDVATANWTTAQGGYNLTFLNDNATGNLGTGNISAYSATFYPKVQFTNTGGANFSGNVDIAGTTLANVTRRTTLFSGSVLINAQQSDTINHWIGNPYQTWTLCFRKSTNGTSSAAWHAACDNKGQTVTIASLSTGQLMGGYAACSFMSRGGYYHGCGASNFLFNLTKGHKYQFGGEVLGNNNYAWYYGIYDATTYGPTFGGGHDWYVADGLNSGYCNLGYSYPCRKGTYNTAACQQDLCGTYNTWTITDLETWYVNN